MGVLCYLGFLVLIPLFTEAKNDTFVAFHIRQGLVLFVIEIVAWFLAEFIFPFLLLYQIINLCVVILSIIGIINVAQGEKKELPMVGQLAHSFKI